jgi:hypothetical protein
MGLNGELTDEQKRHPGLEIVEQAGPNSVK